MATSNENIQARLQLKYDTYTNWYAKDPVLLSGEIAIATLAEDLAEEKNADTGHPILFKVGNGSAKFSALPWASALAADVYSWAKKTEDEFKTWVAGLVPVEITVESSGPVVTNVTATCDDSGHHISITRSNVKWDYLEGKPRLVNTITATDDDVVVLTPETAAGGEVTITGAHAAKGPSSGYTGAQTSTTIDGFGESMTIKVPKLTVDKYGHTNSAEDVNYTIQLPTPTDTNTVTTVTGSKGISVSDNGTTGNHAYTVSLNLDATNAGNVALSQSGSGLKADITTSNHSIAVLGKNPEVDDATSTLTVGNYDITIATGENVTTTYRPDRIETEVSSGTYKLLFPERDGIIATTEQITEAVTGAVEYLGTVSALTGLSTSAGKGDFYRVASAFGSVHAGDLIIAEKNNPSATIDGTNWSVIHGDEGDITEVKVGNAGLTGGGSVGSVTISHATPSGASAGDKGSSSTRTYLTKVTTDQFGHVTGYATATETVVNTDTEYDLTTTAQTDGSKGTLKLTGSDGSVDTVNVSGDNGIKVYSTASSPATGESVGTITIDGSAMLGRNGWSDTDDGWKYITSPGFVQISPNAVTYSGSSSNAQIHTDGLTVKVGSLRRTTVSTDGVALYDTDGNTVLTKINTDGVALSKNDATSGLTSEKISFSKEYDSTTLSATGITFTTPSVEDYSNTAKLQSNSLEFTSKEYGSSITYGQDHITYSIPSSGIAGYTTSASGTLLFPQLSGGTGTIALKSDIPTIPTLATVATTGNIEDLVQTANTYITIDCGSASTVI